MATSAHVEDAGMDDFKALSPNDVDDEDKFYRENQGTESKKKGWFKNVGKVMSQRGSLTRMFGGRGISGSSEADSDAATRAKVMACRSNMASENGGIRIQDPAQATIVRSVLTLMLRQVGRNLFKGGNVMNVSFPIECCQPRTILEIGASAVGYFKDFLPQAAAEKDPVERMKLVVSCFIASISLTSGNFLKPLNPILGETLQVDYNDGSSAYLEQTCHHPPVSSYLLEGPNKEYRYYGHVTFALGFGYNKMLLKNSGLRVVEFKDGGKIEIGFNDDRFNNVFWGEMYHEALGELCFMDEQNGLRACVNFAPPSESGGKQKKTPPSDYFSGSIESFDPSRPEEPSKKVAAVEGSWVGFCDIGPERMWEHATLRPAQAVPLRSRVLLPSDSTFRIDRSAMLQNDYKTANAEKIRLEQQQREEKKLRAASTTN